jgi:hypothetical protein
LGTFPDISLECAKLRHQFARNLLAQGVDPAAMKAALGKHAFVVKMRDWAVTQEASPRYGASHR